MCRQGSNNLPFSTNLPYQLKTHFNIRNTFQHSHILEIQFEKTNEKHTPLIPYPPPLLLSPSFEMNVE